LTTPIAYKYIRYMIKIQLHDPFSDDDDVIVGEIYGDHVVFTFKDLMRLLNNIKADVKREYEHVAVVSIECPLTSICKFAYTDKCIGHFNKCIHYNKIVEMIKKWRRA